MEDSKFPITRFIERVLPLLVLAVLAMYTYAKVFEHPYGMAWDAAGNVTKVFVNQREPTVHLGDRLVRVGSVDFSAFARDLDKDLFEGAKVGDSVPVVVERQGQRMNVSWHVPGSNRGELRDQLFGQWFLSYFFWGAGTLTLLLVRPRDRRWILLGVFNYLTAIWLMAGSGLSAFHIWKSALVLRSAWWLSVPLYLHLHWIFPRPLGKLPRWVVWGAYGVFGGLAIAQAFQLVSPNAYFLAFLLAFGGSLLLLYMHFVRQPEIRKILNLLMAAASVAIGPALIIGVAAQFVGPPPAAAFLSLLTFPLLPFTYLYSAYRGQLGGVEVRLNRLVSIYGSLVLLGAVTLPVLMLILQLPLYTMDKVLVAGIMGSLLAAVLSLWGYPRFQRIAERQVLGVAVPSRELQQTYSAHLTSSKSFDELTGLLETEVLRTLLVREFAFISLDHESPRLLLCRGIDAAAVPLEQADPLLRSIMRQNIAEARVSDPRYAWIRLVLPLEVQDKLLGFWLFGRRDPDDVYLNVETQVLELFANQTAIALSNILQTQRLHALYRADINRHEEERRSLARELHDSVLSELGSMVMNADIGSLPRNFQASYRRLTEHLREIVSDLRPPMLSYGLEPAIHELADNLMERSKDALEIEVELEQCSDGGRPPGDVEQHLFRIVQEACENIVRHSGGTRARIAGTLAGNLVELRIEDDGRGIDMADGKTQLYDLLSERHYGLAGMMERAELIDAQIRLDTAKGAGTRVYIRWHANGAGEQKPQGSDGSSS